MKPLDLELGVLISRSVFQRSLEFLVDLGLVSGVKTKRLRLSLEAQGLIYISDSGGRSSQSSHTHMIGAQSYRLYSVMHIMLPCNQIIHLYFGLSVKLGLSFALTVIPLKPSGS